MMILIYLLLFFSSIFVHSQNPGCNICIIDSICGDDYIHFNLSVTGGCSNPMDIFYSYDTDIDSLKHYSNITTDCENCFLDLMIVPIKDAWDYILTLDSPKSTDDCSKYVAHCGGTASWLVWIATASLSGLFILSGALLCIIRYYRTQRQIKLRQKKIDDSVISS